MFFLDHSDTRIHARTARLSRVVMLLCCASAAHAAGAAATVAPTAATRPTQAVPAQSWGAIAAMGDTVGYSFNHPSRALAEIAARAQCDRTAGRPATCAIRAYFDRSCGAYATGNYGEWATGVGPTAAAASREAAVQCDAHLPTQPCKVMVSVCSPR